jgi:hypothetical protein
VSDWFAQLDFLDLVGFPLRFVEAIFLSSVLLIELYILFDAPFNDEALRLPLFAANAAPAAICCFFDFAGINFLPQDVAAHGPRGSIPNTIDSARHGLPASGSGLHLMEAATNNHGSRSGLGNLIIGYQNMAPFIHSPRLLGVVWLQGSGIQSSPEALRSAAGSKTLQAAPTPASLVATSL